MLNIRKVTFLLFAVFNIVVCYSSLGQEQTYNQEMIVELDSLIELHRDSGNHQVANLLEKELLLRKEIEKAIKEEDYRRAWRLNTKLDRLLGNVGGKVTVLSKSDLKKPDKITKDLKPSIFDWVNQSYLSYNIEYLHASGNFARPPSGGSIFDAFHGNEGFGGQGIVAFSNEVFQSFHRNPNKIEFGLSGEAFLGFLSWDWSDLGGEWQNAEYFGSRFLYYGSMLGPQLVLTNFNIRADIYYRYGFNFFDKGGATIAFEDGREIKLVQESMGIAEDIQKMGFNLRVGNLIIGYSYTWMRGLHMPYYLSTEGFGFYEDEPLFFISNLPISFHSFKIGFAIN